MLFFSQKVFAADIPQVVANVMGLTDSKYQYVIDALESDEYHRRREEGEEEDRRKVSQTSDACLVPERFSSGMLIKCSS